MSTTDSPGESDDVGSLADEATKLLGALAGWAREHAGDLGTGVTDLAGHAAAVAGGIDDHIDTGAEECTYCPICRTLHSLRSVSPEVKTHLAVAATSLAQAVAALMAPPESPAGEADDTGGVEHIDVSEEWPD